jgi:sporulation protein YlmC with PRC-barrel domain
MRADRFDLVYRVLDDEMIDPNGRRCGRVDDIELDGGPGKPTHVAALLSGPGAFKARFPRRLRDLADRIFADSCVRVPWSEVRDIDTVIRLKRPGEDLGLGRGDDEVGAVIRHLPGS